MKASDIPIARLTNQHLSKPEKSTPGEIVHRLGAMQAQDYLGALWSIGQRLDNCSEQDVEEAIKSRSIIRTWPMRGTLHFVHRNDAKWMLRLLTPRVIQRAKSRYLHLGLDKKTFQKCNTLFEKVLRDNNAMTRTDIYDRLSKAKINVEGERGIHIINHAAQEGVICLGPRSGKQHTFVLLDEWIPEADVRTVDEALSELTKRYYTSHGPATANDFAWWAGLTLAEVKRGLSMNSEALEHDTIDNTQYWFSNGSHQSVKRPHCRLLSWFDEYVISYKDRSAAVDSKTEKFIEKPKNGLYTPVILLNGKIAGTWKRNFERDGVVIHSTSFRKFSAAEVASVNREIRRYKKFLAHPVE